MAATRAFRDTPIDEITSDHIQALFDTKQPETEWLEYKSQFAMKGDNGKDLKRDFCAFANAMGGRIIFGIEEGKGDDKGLPVALQDVVKSSAAANKDTLMQQVESLFQNVEPRLRSPKIKFVTMPDNTEILVLDIARGWRPPHRSGETDGFHVRAYGKNRPLSIEEVRNMFQLGDYRKDMNSWVADRVQKIKNNDPSIPQKIHKGKIVIVLHVVPLGALNGLFAIEFDREAQERLNTRQNPSYFSHPFSDPNFFGLYGTDSFGYFQWFREGYAERVINLNFDNTGSDGTRFINLTYMWNSILGATHTMLWQYQNLGGLDSVWIKVSLLQTENTHATEGYRLLDSEINLSEMPFPEVFVDDPTNSIQALHENMSSVNRVLNQAFGIMP